MVEFELCQQARRREDMGGLEPFAQASEYDGQERMRFGRALLRAQELAQADGASQQPRLAVSGERLRKTVSFLTARRYACGS